MKLSQENIPLARKGLFLVSVPIAFELLFLIALFVVLNQSNIDLMRAAKAKIIVSKVQEQKWILVRCYTAALSYLYTGSSYYQDRAEKCKRDYEQNLKALQQLLGDDGDDGRSLSTLQKNAVVFESILQKSKALVDRGEVRKLVPLLLKNKKLIAENTTMGDSILRKYGLVSTQAPIVMARARIRLFLFVGLAVLLSLITGWFMSHFYSKGIAGRLKALNENANRIARGEAFVSGVPGADEIASLDQVFRNMSEQISDARRKERAIIEYAVDVICSLDKDLRFTAVNASCLRHWGYAPSELIGKSFCDILPPKDVGAAIDAIQNSIEQKSESAFETRMSNQAGQDAVFLVSLTWSARDQTFFLWAHDITERKRLDALRKEFVSMLSHDLSMPLSKITANLQALERTCQDELGAKGMKIVGNSLRGAERLSKLVGELLLMEQSKDSHLDLVLADADMASIMEQSLESVEEFAQQQGIRLQVEGSGGIVRVDADRIVQVLVNLLSNAVKFSPAGSCITVVAQPAESELEIRVTDQGRGVPAQMRETIFERFKQVEDADASSKGGFGLGLPICKAIIEEHGGSIGCTSEPGKGSTFWFRLPLGL